MPSSPITIESLAALHRESDFTLAQRMSRFDNEERTRSPLGTSAISLPDTGRQLPCSTALNAHDVTTERHQTFDAGSYVDGSSTTPGSVSFQPAKVRNAHLPAFSESAPPFHSTTARNPFSTLPANDIRQEPSTRSLGVHSPLVPNEPLAGPIAMPGEDVASFTDSSPPRDIRPGDHEQPAQDIFADVLARVEELLADRDARLRSEIDQQLQEYDDRARANRLTREISVG